jgi:hypothetical protein
MLKDSGEFCIFSSLSVSWIFGLVYIRDVTVGRFHIQTRFIEFDIHISNLSALCTTKYISPTLLPLFICIAHIYIFFVYVHIYMFTSKRSNPCLVAQVRFSPDLFCLQALMYLSANRSLTSLCFISIYYTCTLRMTARCYDCLDIVWKHKSLNCLTCWKILASFAFLVLFRFLGFLDLYISAMWPLVDFTFRPDSSNSIFIFRISLLCAPRNTFQ